jgi:hypothetical protein
MLMNKKRLAALLTLSSGTLFVSTCEAVAQTVGLALDIVNVWV